MPESDECPDIDWSLPLVEECDFDEHEWSDADECEFGCGDDRCCVTCVICGFEDVACEG